MRTLVLSCIVALGLSACGSAPETQEVPAQRIVAANGEVAVCGDGLYEKTWQTAIACGDTIYRPLEADSDIWIDPEFKCEYFLSRYHDGSRLRLAPGAPRMAIQNGNYVHVCRTSP